MARYFLTGFTLPSGAGLQWSQKPSNRDIVRDLLVQLEDRTVLWADMGIEDEDHCRRSAHQIRNIANAQLPLVRHGGEFEMAFKTIRRAAQDFVHAAGKDAVNFSSDRNLFELHLRTMRRIIGTEVAWMASQCRIDLDDAYANALPLQDLTWLPGLESAP